MKAFEDRERAAQAGRTTMSRLTPEEKTELGERGGNTLLRLMGINHYAALGRKSAEMGREARRLSWQPTTRKREPQRCEQAIVRA